MGSGSGRNDEEQKSQKPKKDEFSSFSFLLQYLLCEGPVRAKGGEVYELDTEECKRHLKAELLANRF